MNHVAMETLLSITSNEIKPNLTNKDVFPPYSNFSYCSCNHEYLTLQ